MSAKSLHNHNEYIINYLVHILYELLHLQYTNFRKNLLFPDI
jgi:hypothetical protein